MMLGVGCESVFQLDYKGCGIGQLWIVFQQFGVGEGESEGWSI